MANVRWRFARVACALVAAVAFGALGQQPAPSLQFRIGEAVEVRDTTGWRFGIVDEVNGERVSVNTYMGLPGTYDRNTLRHAAKLDPDFAAGLKVGQRVSACDGKAWRDATVVRAPAAGGDVVVRFDEPDPAGAHVQGEVRDNWVRPLATAGTAGVDDGFDGIPTGDYRQVADAPAGSAAGPEAWRVKPWPAPADGGQASAKWPTKAVVLLAPGRVPGSMYESPQRVLCTSVEAAQAVVVFDRRANFDQPGICEYRRVDLAKGTALELADLPAGDELVALAPGGRQAVARVTAPTGLKPAPQWQYDPDHSALRLYALGAAKPAGGQAWRPYDPGAMLAWVGFAGDGHLLTQSAEGVIVYWALPPASDPAARPRAVYRLKAGAGMPPALTPDGRYYAVEEFGAIRFVETATGAPAGRVAALPFDRPSAVAFRPDAPFAAVRAFDRVDVVHVGLGRALKTIPNPDNLLMSGLPNRVGLDWVGKTHLLSHDVVVDVGARVPAWRYNFGENGPVTAVLGGRVWCARSPRVGGNEPPYLCSAVLPHPAALKAPPRWKADDLTLLRPGERATVEVETDAPEPLRARIRAALEQQVRDLGMTVAPDAPLRVRAQTAPGPERELLGQWPPDNKPRRAAEKIHKLSVTVDGKEAWSAKTVAPVYGMVGLRPGQTFEQRLAEVQAPSYEWLATARLPQQLVRPGKYDLPWEWEVWADGVRAYEQPK